MSQKKRKISLKKAVAGGAVAVTLSLGFWASKAVYTVKSVIDGDTFVTAEDQYIRIANIDAPERGRCGSDEATSELSKLVSGKKVFMKVIYFEGNRQIAYVYTLQGDVAINLLKKGVVVAKNTGKSNKELTNATDYARERKLGVFSDKCTQEKNSENPKCNIKGNISQYGKFYRTPDCSQYNITILQLYLGDQWFCTEKEARNAGFTKSPDCP